MIWTTAICKATSTLLNNHALLSGSIKEDGNNLKVIKIPQQRNTFNLASENRKCGLSRKQTIRTLIQQQQSCNNNKVVTHTDSTEHPARSTLKT